MMAIKESSSLMSSLAARIMGGYQPTRDEIESLAASVMSQDETKGNSGRPREPLPEDPDHLTPDERGEEVPEDNTDIGG